MTFMQFPFDEQTCEFIMKVKIPNNKSQKVHVMFDNGSELALVSRIFQNWNILPYEDTIYTLAGVGGAAMTYNASDGI